MRNFAAIAVVVALLAPLHTAAQSADLGPAEGDTTTAPVPPTPTHDAEIDVSTRARADFREGMAAYEARRFHEAITAFQRAATLVPSADLWFNIARAYEELGEIEPAIEYYRRYLRDRVDPPDRDRVQDHIAALEERAESERVDARRAPTTGTLRIDVDVAGASVLVDDQAVGVSPLAVPLTYQAGTHLIDVRLPGRVPFRAEVRIDPGSSVTAIASMPQMTEYRSVRGTRRVTWVMAALAAASLGASIGLGVHAASLNAEGNRSDAGRWARYSDYAIGGVALFGVGTVTLYFAEGRSLRTERIGPSDR